MENISLELLVNRYIFTKKLIENHPNDELLKRKLNEHMEAIAEYVSSERFSHCLKAFNL